MTVMTEIMVRSLFCFTLVVPFLPENKWAMWISWLIMVAISTVLTLKQ